MNKQALTAALMALENLKGKEVVLSGRYIIEDAARLVERLLPGECENCQGDPHKIDGWTCHVCHGSGQVWDEGIVEAVARVIYEFQRDDEEAGHSFHGGDWVRTMSQTPMHKETYRRQARAVLSAIAQLAEAGSQ